MPQDASTAYVTLKQVFAWLGGGAVIVTALAAFFGKLWATSVTARQNTRLSEQLERVKADLKVLTDEQSDAMVRKREAYSKMATTMRVLIKAHDGATQAKQKADFLEAYDQCCVWASEAVIDALGALFDLLVRRNAVPAAISETDVQAAYQAAILAMRRDSGFRQSTFLYRFVKF